VGRLALALALIAAWGAIRCGGTHRR
jgi:hypothetical protein